MDETTWVKVIRLVEVLPARPRRGARARGRAARRGADPGRYRRDGRVNFDRARPPALLNLNEAPELRGHSRERDAGLGSGLTYTEAMGLAEPLLALAEASRTVGGPQIRNRGTLGGNLGTASPAGDALPPLLVYGARSGSSTGGSRTVPFGTASLFLVCSLSISLPSTPPSPTIPIVASN